MLLHHGGRREGGAGGGGQGHHLPPQVQAAVVGHAEGQIGLAGPQPLPLPEGGHSAGLFEIAVHLVEVHHPVLEDIMHLFRADLRRGGRNLRYDALNVGGAHLRLEDVLPGAQGDGLLGVGELGVVGQDDEHRKGEDVPDFTHQLQPVHSRHADVGKDHVGLLLQNPAVGLLSIDRGGDGAGRLTLLDAVHQPVPDGGLVVHYHNMKHGAPPFSIGCGAGGR